MTRVPLDGKNSFAALSPDGALTIPTGMSFLSNRSVRSTRAYRVATGRPAGPPLRPGGLIVDAAFSPDGRSVATLGARDGSSAEGQELRSGTGPAAGGDGGRRSPPNLEALSYRPDGRRLAVLCGGGELLVFDPDAGREALRWRAHDAEPAHHWVNNGEVTFSPDGRSVLTWGMGNDARVWEADTGQPRYPPISHRDKCHDLQFSPDGRLMALASYDGSVRVRDFATGTVLAELPAHPDIVYSAGFSPDGRLLVTACRDHTVRVWDWRAGRLACPPFEHAKDAVAACFTPDGRWVLSASADGTARAWDWRTGKPITPPLTFIERRTGEHRRDPGRQACGCRRVPGRAGRARPGRSGPGPTPTRTRCASGPSCLPASGSTRGAGRSTCRPTSGSTAGVRSGGNRPRPRPPSLTSTSAPPRAAGREFPTGAPRPARRLGETALSRDPGAARLHMVGPGGGLLPRQESESYKPEPPASE